MPYITETQRQKFDIFIKNMPKIEDPGELNYIFYKISLKYLEGKGESYQTYNDIAGVFSCCDKELYRRRTVLYEGKKINLNGDIT